MKTLKLLGAALAAVTMTFTAQAEKTAKAVLENDGATLRFVYDETDYGAKDAGWFSVAEAEMIDPHNDYVPWCDCGVIVTKVVFDPSFAAYRPKQCGAWFYDFVVLAAVEGLTNLDTSVATNMAYMFYGCSSLTSLDVSGFDTANVTDMVFMFYGCSSLTVLDVSGFDTANVTDMYGMFLGCSLLTTLNLASFDTANVTDMDYMFCGCSKLTTIGVSGFDTANVTSMASMFYGCSSLTSLDVSGFDTANVTDMDYMFYDCSSLEAICASGRFVTDQVSDSSSMFEDCSMLVGGAGTTYDNTKTGKTYARIDGEGGQPGYFTRGTDAKVVVEDGGKTLRFVYDGKDYGTKGTAWFSVAEAEENGPFDDVPWCDCGETVTNVVFDSSFAAYRPKQCGSWFYEFDVLAAVEGLTNLDTSVATSMAYMFSGCSSLTSLDMSGFDTANVTDMFCMFDHCDSLTSIDVSGFDTANVTTMGDMFCGCSSLMTIDVSGFKTANVTCMYGMFDHCDSLTSIDVSGFKTANVTDIGAMFRGCSSLMTIDVSGFDTANVTYMAYMFYGCSSLMTICASDRFVTDQVSDSSSMFEVSDSSSMFEGCSNLVGGAGTKYDNTKTDKTYARIDGGTSAPGYFTCSKAPTGGYAAWAAEQGLAGDDAAWDAKPALWGGEWENAFIYTYGEGLAGGTLAIMNISFDVNGKPVITTTPVVEGHTDFTPAVIGTPNLQDWTSPVMLENKSGDDWTLPVGAAANFFRVRLSE